MTESIEQFLKRGGKIRKVDFSEAYKRLTPRYIKHEKKKKLQELDRQKIRDKAKIRI